MLEEKIAVVTGASRGIGRAIAKELALKGAFVIVNYNGSKQAADETVNEITQAGGKAVSVQCNVADAAECEAFINNIISEYGRIDILVNNAGIVRDNLLMRISEKDFDAVIDTNLIRFLARFRQAHLESQSMWQKQWPFWRQMMRHTLPVRSFRSMAECNL